MNYNDIKFTIRDNNLKVVKVKPWLHGYSKLYVGVIEHWNVIFYNTLSIYKTFHYKNPISCIRKECGDEFADYLEKYIKLQAFI